MPSDWHAPKERRLQWYPWRRACAIVKLQLSRCTLVRRIIKEGHNVVCVSTNLSWFGTCVGACSCASSNSLQKNQCNTNEPLSPPPLVCLRQVHSLLRRAHKRCRVGPLIVANHGLRSRRHFFWAGAEGERRNVEDARWEKRSPPLPFACSPCAA